VLILVVALVRLCRWLFAQAFHIAERVAAIVALDQ
jgi:hypothetical protein